jgi:hypothetical protein
MTLFVPARGQDQRATPIRGIHSTTATFAGVLVCQHNAGLFDSSAKRVASPPKSAKLAAAGK